MANSGKGRVWPSEKKQYKDPISGLTIYQLTDYKGHSNHLYFTENGWYDGNQRILFTSDRDNRTNLFSLHLESGEMTQLTDSDGSGVGAFLDPDGKRAFYRTGGKVMALDLETLEETQLYEQPEGFNVGRGSCTADGKYVVTSLSEDLSKRIRLDLGHGYVGHRELMEAGPQCKIIRIPTNGGEAEILYEEKYWVGHINCSPTQPNLITFCHEGPWYLVDQRIWGFDLETRQSWQIRPRKEQYELVGHEYWFMDGVHVGYHGFRENGMAFFGKIKSDNTDMEEIEFEFVNWHAHSNDFSHVVVDGKAPLRNMVIWKRTGSTFSEPKILCEHRCSFHSQSLHAHPRFSPDGKKLLYSSDRNGYGNLYMVDIPDDFESLPNETHIQRRVNTMVSK